MQIKKYPDGGKYVVNDNSEWRAVYMINSYEDLFLLKSFKDANKNLTHIVIPCMFQQQHDRRFFQNESFELKLVCDFINSCNFESVEVFHPHSDVTPALLNNCTVIDNTSFILNVLSTLGYGHELPVLMSSDAGGYKPLMKLCYNIDWHGEVYSASKSRVGGNIVQSVGKEDFGGKDVIIVDDICVNGGTFIGLADILMERNVGKLFLAVSHMTIPNPNPELFIKYDMVFTTNSKGIEYNEKEKLTVIENRF